MDRDFLVKKLETDDTWLIRALVALNKRQNVEEQTAESTIYHNGRGFRPCHARMGTSMANFFNRNGYLSPKQIRYWRARDKKGNMRIGIYANQLLLVAAEKAHQKAA